MPTDTPFDRWYAAIERAVKECGRVRAVDGADAVTMCRERVAELGK